MMFFFLPLMPKITILCYTMPVHDGDPCLFFQFLNTPQDQLKQYRGQVAKTTLSLYFFSITIFKKLSLLLFITIFIIIYIYIVIIFKTRLVFVCLIFLMYIVSELHLLRFIVVVKLDLFKSAQAKEKCFVILSRESISLVFPSALIIH